MLLGISSPGDENAILFLCLVFAGCGGLAVFLDLPNRTASNLVFSAACIALTCCCAGLVIARKRLRARAVRFARAFLSLRGEGRAKVSSEELGRLCGRTRADRDVSQMLRRNYLHNVEREAASGNILLHSGMEHYLGKKKEEFRPVSYWVHLFAYMFFYLTVLLVVIVGIRQELQTPGAAPPAETEDLELIVNSAAGFLRPSSVNICTAIVLSIVLALMLAGGLFGLWYFLREMRWSRQSYEAALVMIRRGPGAVPAADFSGVFGRRPVQKEIPKMVKAKFLKNLEVSEDGQFIAGVSGKSRGGGAGSRL